MFQHIFGDRGILPRKMACENLNGQVHSREKVIRIPVGSATMSPKACNNNKRWIFDAVYKGVFTKMWYHKDGSLGDESNVRLQLLIALLIKGITVMEPWNSLPNNHKRAVIWYHLFIYFLLNTVNLRLCNLATFSSYFFFFTEQGFWHN